ncbi:MAG: hypothetical protein RLZZ244_203, partial [Verrucomicrobiota bacterium]
RGVEERLEFASRESKRILLAHRLDWHSTSQDAQTLSLLWAVLDPEHHAPFRAAHYKDHCRRVGLEPAPPRKRYGHFLQLLEAFAAEWVVPDATLHAAHEAAWAGQGAAGESGLPVAARIWRGVWGRVWSSEKDDMKHNENDEPEVFMYRGAPFDPEAFQGTYWILKVGERAQFWELFKQEGIGAMGYDNWPDLLTYESREAITADIPNREPEWTGNNYNHTLALWDFSRNIREGDILIAANGRTEYVGVGVVNRTYGFEPEEAPYHRIGVEWVRTGNWETEPGQQLALKTLLNISQYDNARDAYWPRRILAQIYGQPLPAGSSPQGTEAQFLADSFLPERDWSGMLRSLRTKKNIVLQGPPGTGKTFIARRLAYALMREKDPERLLAVQFHQSYSYEDFIQGYRPREGGGFERRNGVFYRFCEKARQDPDRDYVFLIDEINRGNLSKIFGELMMLIEADKRGEEHRLQLAYSEENEFFHIPANVHFIGTMNTADRSLALVDYALRRRFAFHPVQPQFQEKLLAHLRGHVGVSRAMAERVMTRLQALNAVIVQDPNLGEGFAVGHSYFCQTPTGDPDEQQWYDHIIEHEIAPLLREYWFDHPEVADRHIAALLA